MFGKKKKRPYISNPSNFEHRVHTGFDSSQGKFVGLPLQWAGVVEAVKAARPKPIIDPSLITATEMQPLKVGWLCRHVVDQFIMRLFVSKMSIPICLLVCF